MYVNVVDQSSIHTEVTQLYSLGMPYVDTYLGITDSHNEIHIGYRQGSYSVQYLEIENQSAYLVLNSSLSNSLNTASTIGTIMAVVAVFEIHMDKNIVGSMKPNINLRGLVPIQSKTFKATLLCKLECSTAMATMTPEINIMLVSFRYSRPTASVVIIPAIIKFGIEIGAKKLTVYYKQLPKGLSYRYLLSSSHIVRLT